MNFINYMKPSYDICEINAVNEYMKSGGWLTEYEKTRELEKMLADYVKVPYCSVLTNGTVTLIAALMACGIKPYDEVIVPDFTMAATSHAVELIGAKAVFVDIERDTFCMDFESLKDAKTDKTKAVILVELNGRYPKYFRQIIEYCRDNKLFLIEDSAQALGSTYKGQALGTFGDFGSYSFSMPKIITMGQGGALVCNSTELFDQIIKIRDFGRESAGSDHYVSLGANFKFTDIQAVIGLEQVKKLPKRIETKKLLCKRYDQILRNIPEIEIVENNYEDTAPCFYEILCEEREELAAYLKSAGIGARKFYPPLHSEPAYNRKGTFRIAEEVSKKGLWLPSYVTLSMEEIEYICNEIERFYRNKR